MQRDISSITAGGLGKDVAALSRYIIIYSLMISRSATELFENAIRTDKSLLSSKATPQEHPRRVRVESTFMTSAANFSFFSTRAAFCANVSVGKTAIYLILPCLAFSFEDFRLLL
jgi:hypothetical protein